MNNALYMPYYGNWRNRTFADIFNSFEVFSEEWKQTVFASVINDNDLEILYYHELVDVRLYITLLSVLYV